MTSKKEESVSHTEQLQTYAYNEGKASQVFTPDSVAALSSLLGYFFQKQTPVSLLGGRNSFGDVFLPAGVAAIDLTGLPANLILNSQGPVLTVDAGVRSVSLLEYLTETGYYLPSQSGSYLNTIGGDIAANVNGKDSWKHGSFYHRINSMKVMLANGTVISVDRSEPDIFNAIVGGLGLIGIILSAELIPVMKKSDALVCHQISTRNICETISTLENLTSRSADFAYAWVDALCTGAQFGRAIIETATFAPAGNKVQVEARKHSPDSVFGVKDDWFWNLIRKGRSGAHLLAIDKGLFRCFNSLRYNYLNIIRKDEVIKDYRRYQYPISNLLPNWNKQFIPRGMQEVQCLFEFKHFENAFRELVVCCFKHHIYPELCAIRRHLHDDAFLSFSGNGLSVTINYDRYGRGDKQLFALERELIAIVIKYSGKVYLAKFPYINKSELKAMYSGLGAFITIKKQLDPHGMFASAAWSRWMQE